MSTPGSACLRADRHRRSKTLMLRLAVLVRAIRAFAFGNAVLARIGLFLDLADFCMSGWLVDVPGCVGVCDEACNGANAIAPAAITVASLTFMGGSFGCISSPGERTRSPEVQTIFINQTSAYLPQHRSKYLSIPRHDQACTCDNAAEPPFQLQFPWQIAPGMRFGRDRRAQRREDVLDAVANQIARP